FKFMFMFMKEIFKGVFHVFRIPLIIAGIALFVGIFSRQAMCVILFLDFGVVVMAMPAVFTGKTLVENIIITQKGRKFSGICTGYKLEHWNCGHDVYWINEKNIKLHWRFDVLMIQFKYPCKVNVYSLNHSVNLGVFTVL
ncbi:MAG: hypothetical protein K2O29_07375, partial [Ruminococcus sp.]|nr:hypothetical protein [Ruminococcus sp.]